MAHKLVVLVLGILCLMPAYAVVQIVRACRNNKAKNGAIDNTDLMVIMVLSICGMAMCASAIFGLN